MTIAQRHLPAHRLSTMLGTRVQEQPAYAWLADGIRHLVTNGRVLHGTMLPSERELVTALGLSRTTITRAYQELRERGFAEVRRGSGTRIQIPGGDVGGGAEPLIPSSNEALRSSGLDLTCGAPLAPVGLAQYYERALDQLPGYIGGMGYYPLGLPILREAIANDYTARGLPTDPEQIIVTAGALSAIPSIARAILSPGAHVLAESPSYPNSVSSLRHQGSRISTLPILPEGSDLTGIENMLARGNFQAMLCLPDFHNPTGTLLDNAGRERWVNTLVRHGVSGIIDETNVKLWLDEKPETLPMAAFSPDLITIGSASKTYWGGLRMGWIRAPHKLVGAIHQARSSFDLGTPVLEQLVLNLLMRERAGLDDETRTALRANRDWVFDQLREATPEWNIRKPPGGLSLWCNLPLPRATVLSEKASKAGLLLTPGSVFAVEDHGLENWLRVPYALGRSDLELAIPKLIESWNAIV